MKMFIAIITCCVSLIITLGLLNVLNPVARAAPIAIEETPVVSGPVSASGFVVTSTALNVRLEPDSNILVPLTVTRESAGTSGNCTGHYAITETEAISHVLYQHTLTRTVPQNVVVVQLRLLSWNADGAGNALGDSPLLHNGETGLADFTAANEPDFDAVVAKFTDGVLDAIAMDYGYFDNQGHALGGGSYLTGEYWAFRTGSDLFGYQIDMIRRDVKQLVLQSASANFEVDWSIWGRRLFSHWLQFSPGSGTLAVGQSQVVSVALSAVDMQPGLYTTTLMLDPGQTCDAPISIPVSMTVSEPCTPVTGVDLNLMTLGTLLPNTPVQFRATVLPDTASGPFGFMINQGSGAASSDNPISFTWNFTGSGTNTTTISVWNCAMLPAEAVTVSVLSVVLEPVITHTVYLPAVIKR